MAQPPPQDGPQDGARGRSRNGARAALGLAVLWLLGAAILALSVDWSQTGPPVQAGAAAAALLPSLILWGVARMIDWLGALQAEVSAQRVLLEALAQALHRPEADPHDDPGAGSSESACFSSRRAAAAGEELAPAGQLALPGPAQPPQAQLDMAVLIRALNFPEDEADTEGFEALRRALMDHPTAQLIRAAQDVLTGLAQEGIYMDDLTPDRARPVLWRAFGQGARGPELAALAGVRDRSCLALSVGRMRQDAGFREVAHRFLRGFDQCLQRVAETASDAELAALADTRSARAFMLLGRATGMLGR